jgi:hypothetical protein
MRELAEKIYNNSLDMDFMDYEDTKEEDIRCLINDLELLKQSGNGALLKAIEIFMEY